MARSTTKVLGAGGIVGKFLDETLAFPDDGQPTLAYTTIQYKISGESQDQSVNYPWDTTWTPADIRSFVKDLIKADVLAKFGLTVTKAQIKMWNSPE